MQRKYPFAPIVLPYAFNALEPLIGEETLYFHYEKLYKGYVNRLNKIIENNPDYRNFTIEEIIIMAYNTPKDINVSRAAGGVYNHEMFFESLSPERECAINSTFWKAVEKDYNNRVNFLEDIANTANNVFGSGYAWVAADEKGKIYVAQYANQSTPLTQNATPLLPIDVWEHAYYLDYRHDRTSYIERIFDLINWEVVSARYE